MSLAKLITAIFDVILPGLNVQPCRQVNTQTPAPPGQPSHQARAGSTVPSSNQYKCGVFTYLVLCDQISVLAYTNTPRHHLDPDTYMS